LITALVIPMTAQILIQRNTQTTTASFLSGRLEQVNTRKK